MYTWDTALKGVTNAFIVTACKIGSFCLIPQTASYTNAKTAETNDSNKFVYSLKVPFRLETGEYNATVTAYSHEIGSEPAATTFVVGKLKQLYVSCSLVSSAL